MTNKTDLRINIKARILPIGRKMARILLGFAPSSKSLREPDYIKGESEQKVSLNSFKNGEILLPV